jgi:hypothetical protein
MATKVESKPRSGSEDLASQVEDLRAQITAVQSALAEFRSGYRFNGDDSAFLIWVLGFTAGAHLEKDGERGERVFARCRDLYMKTFPGAGPAGGNAS